MHVDTVYTDFEKAFDLRVWCVRWFIKIVLSPKFIVNYNIHFSEKYNVNSDVPQGSNLGPLLLR